jgi:UDP-N-acetylmuramoyl-L-alanyl-D-glutamate--2,6-diaminopimelate ligase
MRLGELLRGVRVRKLYTGAYGTTLQTQEREVQQVREDSRRVERGDLFVALRGAAVDGHRYIDQAVRAGAVAVVVQDEASFPDALAMHTRVAKIVVEDTRTALATIAGAFYGHPSRKLRLLGVTGTNGKTTTAHLLCTLLERSGERVGMVGTIQHMIGARSVAATHTTPGPLELNALLDAMVHEGCRSVVMEVSSHALDQHRVHGLVFEGAVFTNLTQDHLDYHGTMEVYADAKKLLFDGLLPGARAVINADDAWGPHMVRDTTARVTTYGMAPGADFRAEKVEVRLEGISMALRVAGQKAGVQSPLTGRFNAYNILAAAAAGSAFGLSWEIISEGIRHAPAISGRFERIASPGGWTVIIDYAHTPDALQRTLEAIRELMPGGEGGRIITVFGCGGNRDRGKRPQMGRIASLGSDLTIVTSDNPRSEDPSAIIAEVMAGIAPGRHVQSEPDRRVALRWALAQASAGDVVLVAGKGHERVQEIAGRRIHFDDHEEVRAALEEHA